MNMSADPQAQAYAQQQAAQQMAQQHQQAKLDILSMYGNMNTMPTMQGMGQMPGNALCTGQGLFVQ